MRIRTLRPDEHDAVGELTVAAYATVDPTSLDDGYGTELRDVGARAAGVEIFVAEDDGTLVGAVTYVPGPDSPAAEFTDADTAGIRMLAVAPEAQGRGAGEALTRACIDRARRDGRTQVVLHSTDRMTTAHRLYERLGFARDPALDWEPEPGFWLRGFRLRLGRG
jgi:ribosomal protein S18 acetylase RimI-like enzyme